MGNKCVGTDSKISKVGKSINELNEAILHINRVIGDLKERILPILGPSIPRATSEETENPENCSIVNELIDMYDKASGARREIEEIIQRLEI